MRRYRWPNLESMSGCSGLERRRPDNPAEHDRGLPQEQFKDLALQPAIPKRHAPEMVLVDDRRFALAIRRARPGQGAHEFLRLRRHMASPIGRRRPQAGRIAVHTMACSSAAEKLSGYGEQAVNDD